MERSLFSALLHAVVAYGVHVLPLCIGLTLVGASPAHPQQTAEIDTNDVYESKGSVAGHFLSVPQTIPKSLMNLILHPLKKFTIWAEHTHLPTRTMNLFMNADRTFGIFPHVQLGGETGTGGGVRVFHSNIAGRGKRFEGLFVYSGGRGQRGDVLYFDPNLAGSRLYSRSEATFLRTRHRSASINGAVRDHSTRRFQIERLDALTTLGWRPHARELEPYQKNVYIEVRFGYGRRDFRQQFEPEGTLTDPGSTSQARLLIGLADVIALYSFGVQISYDDRDYQGPKREISHPLIYRFPGRVIIYTDGFYHNFRDIFYPERGGLLQAEADYVIGSDDVRFVQVTAEVQRFFTLFFRNRILALRARLEKAHRIGDGIIPYPDLAIFGSYHLRGYHRGFLRGEGSLLLSAEYRYPIWDSLRGRWNAFLFWDEGQVFDDYDQIYFDRFRTSYGGGIIFGSETGFLGKLRVGHSAAEEALVGFTLEQKF